MAGREGAGVRRGERWLPRLAAILLLGLLLRVPGLTGPLFEGAAGKQAHTAMVARNLARGRCSCPWRRSAQA